MKNNVRQKYILIILICLITTHLIFKIYNARNLLYNSTEQISFDFYLVSKPQNCFYQAKQGLSLVIKNCQNLEYGRKYTVTGTLRMDTAKSLFSLKTLIVSDISPDLDKPISVFDFCEEKWAQMLSFFEQQRIYIVERAMPYFNSKNSLLPVSLTLGSKAAVLDADFKNKVVEIGIAHLLAVSGSHLVVIIALLELPLRKLPIRLFTFFLIAALLWYTWLIGSGAAVVRATLMTIFTLIYRNILCKQFNQVFGLCLSVILMLYFQPLLVMDVGFLLSVAATSGIILYANRQRCKRNLIDNTRLVKDETQPKNKPKLLQAKFLSRFEPVKDLILASLVAQASVTLITMEAFGQFNLVGVLATLILSPLIEPLMVTTIIFYLLLLPSVYFNLDWSWFLSGLAAFIDFLSEVFSWLVDFLTSLPLTSITGTWHFPLYIWLFYYLALVILLMKPGRKSEVSLKYV